jgi:hypothetical protein
MQGPDFRGHFFVSLQKYYLFEETVALEFSERGMIPIIVGPCTK